MARVSEVQSYLVPKGRFKLELLLNYYYHGPVSILAKEDQAVHKGLLVQIYSVR